MCEWLTLLLRVRVADLSDLPRVVAELPGALRERLAAERLGACSSLEQPSWGLVACERVLIVIHVSEVREPLPLVQPSSLMVRITARSPPDLAVASRAVAEIARERGLLVEPVSQR